MSKNEYRILAVILFAVFWLFAVVISTAVRIYLKTVGA